VAIGSSQLKYLFCFNIPSTQLLFIGRWYIIRKHNYYTIRDSIHLGLPWTVPVLCVLNNSPGYLQNSIHKAKYCRFFQVTKMQHFWQYVQKIWLYNSEITHLEELGSQPNNHGQRGVREWLQDDNTNYEVRTQDWIEWQMDM
jgi:hypothetical protein